MDFSVAKHPHFGIILKKMLKCRVEHIKTAGICAHGGQNQPPAVTNKTATPHPSTADIEAHTRMHVTGDLPCQRQRLGGVSEGQRTTNPFGGAASSQFKGRIGVMITADPDPVDAPNEGRQRVSVRFAKPVRRGPIVKGIAQGDHGGGTPSVHGLLQQPQSPPGVVWWQDKSRPVKRTPLLQMQIGHDQQSVVRTIKGTGHIGKKARSSNIERGRMPIRLRG